MKLKFEGTDEINNELRAIATALRAGNVPSNDLFSEIAKRVSSVEARIHTLESLLTTKTMAGKTKLSDEGQRVGELWYKR